MEIIFQNKQEDFEYFYEYMLKDTERGKSLGKVALRALLMEVALASIVIGSFYAIIFETWQAGFITAAAIFLISILLKLIASGFQPTYHTGLQIYKSEEKSISQKDLKFFQLPRTITIDEQWL